MNNQDYQIDFVIPARKGKIYKNQAELDISSWAGISIGAVHSYGKIKVLEGQMDKWISIEITREVTEADKRLNNGRTFEAYQVGYHTDRFDSDKDIIKAAKKVFKRVFGKGWTLFIRKSRKKKDRIGVYYEDYKKTIATT